MQIPHQPEEGTRSSVALAADGQEPPDVDAGNKTQVFWVSSQSSSLLGYLSSPSESKHFYPLSHLTSPRNDGLFGFGFVDV